MFSELATNDFEETANFDSPPTKITNRVYHVPWWHYLEIEGEIPVQPNVIVCDHALSEMSKTALLYNLRVIKNTLS